MGLKINYVFKYSLECMHVLKLSDKVTRKTNGFTLIEVTVSDCHVIGLMVADDYPV